MAFVSTNQITLPFTTRRFSLGNFLSANSDPARAELARQRAEERERKLRKYIRKSQTTARVWL